MNSNDSIDPAQEQIATREERWYQLHQLESWLDKPMITLSFVWLGLLVWEFTRGLNSLWTGVGTFIWILFIVDFLIRFILAPEKTYYLKRNWLTALSLVVPAFRMFRIVAVFGRVGATASRGFRLIKVIGSMNRSMRALAASLDRRGFVYVVLLTIVVLFAGAAGMYEFEGQSAEGTPGFHGFLDALWWTVMMLTTMGSGYWPVSPEGRALCVVLSLYAFGIFGYVTATIATFFIGRDAETDGGEIAGSAELQAIRADLAALREELRTGFGRP